jgi:hypothetical protein
MYSQAFPGFPGHCRAFQGYPGTSSCMSPPGHSRCLVRQPVEKTASCKVRGRDPACWKPNAGIICLAPLGGAHGCKKIISPPPPPPPGDRKIAKPQFRRYAHILSPSHKTAHLVGMKPRGLYLKIWFNHTSYLPLRDASISDICLLVTHSLGDGVKVLCEDPIP